MKAITIRQPWASLIASGDKKYETRSWPTKHRGPIAIHAGKQDDPDVFQYLLCKTATMAQLEACGITPETLQKLPHGAVIATAELVAVYRIESHHGKIKAVSIPNIQDPLSGSVILPSQKETNLGYWYTDMYAWELRNVKILPEPIPAKGKQGLWDWEPGKEATEQ